MNRILIALSGLLTVSICPLYAGLPGGVWRPGGSDEVVEGVVYFASPERVSNLNEREFAVEFPQEGHSLAVTVVFDESASGLVRLFWRGETQALMLHPNLHEGVGAANRRTLLLESSMFGYDGAQGVFVIQHDGPDNALRAVGFDWVTVSSVWTDDSTPPALVLEDGRTHPEWEILALPAPEPRDVVRGHNVRAVLHARTLLLDGGMIFSVELEEVPQRTVLSGQFIGLPMDVDVAVWVNGHMLRSLGLPCPPADDPGWLESVDGEVHFAGWNRASVLIPAAALRVGENRIVFDWPRGSADPEWSAAAKWVVLDCLFGGVLPGDAGQGSQP